MNTTRIIIVLLGVLSGFIPAYAESPLDATVKALTKAFEAKDWKAAYELTSTYFKEEIPEEAFVRYFDTATDITGLAIVSSTYSSTSAYGVIGVRRGYTDTKPITYHSVFLKNEAGVWKFHNLPMIPLSEPGSLLKRVQAGIEPKEK